MTSPNRTRLQELAGIAEALPASTAITDAMMTQLDKLLQLLSDIDIDKAMQLDPNTQKKLTTMASDFNRFLLKQSRVLGK